jgi:hypothetical protein
MKAILNYALSAQGRKAAAKNNLPATEWQKITTEITGDEIDFADIDYNGNATIFVECQPGNNNYIHATLKFDDIQTKESLFEYLRKERERIKKANELAEEKKKKDRALFEERQAEALRYFKAGEAKNIEWHANNKIDFYHEKLGWVSLRVEDYDEIKEYNARELQRGKEERERIEKVHKAAEQKAIEDRKKLLNWAKDNGSDLLKARIEENLNWISLASEEYFDSILLPDFDREIELDYYRDWDNASLEAIEEVRKVRAHYKDNPAFVSAELVIRQGKRSDEEGEEEEESDKIRDYFIDLTLRSIDGTSETFSKLIG